MWLAENGANQLVQDSDRFDSECSHSRNKSNPARHNIFRNDQLGSNRTPGADIPHPQAEQFG